MYWEFWGFRDIWIKAQEFIWNCGASIGPFCGVLANRCRESCIWSAPPRRSNTDSRALSSGKLKSASIWRRSCRRLYRDASLASVSYTAIPQAMGPTAPAEATSPLAQLPPIYHILHIVPAHLSASIPSSLRFLQHHRRRSTAAPRVRRQAA